MELTPRMSPTPDKRCLSVMIARIAIYLQIALITFELLYCTATGATVVIIKQHNGLDITISELIFG